MEKQINPLTFKGYPLVRQGNIIYYGNITDKYIVMLQVLETEKFKNLDIAKKVAIQLQLTDRELKTKNRIIKKSEKNGFYEAIDLASVWLERALS